MSMNPLEVFFGNLKERIRARLADYSEGDKLADITRFLDERSITTITAQELYDKLVRTPDALVDDYVSILQELIKDNLEELEDIVSLETSITALQAVIATAAKQATIETAIDLVTTAVASVETQVDLITAAVGSSETQIDLVTAAVGSLETQVDLIAVGTNKIIVSGATEAKQDLQATSAKQNNLVVVSDSLLNSNDAEIVVVGQAWVKKREFLVLTSGRYRIKFAIKSNIIQNAYGRLYKNGVAFGTERINATTSFVEYSEDLIYTRDDLLQLYLKHAGPANFCTGRNLRIYGDVEYATTAEQPV